MMIISYAIILQVYLKNGLWRRIKIKKLLKLEIYYVSRAKVYTLSFFLLNKKSQKIEIHFYNKRRKYHGTV